MNRMKATGIASLLTAGLMLGGTLPATAANQYDIDAPAINYTLVSGDYDTEGKAEGPGGSAATGTLACVPGKASYAVGYVGVLDMSKVISKWNSLKGLLPLGSLILGRDMTPYFRALSVTSDPATQQYNTAGKTPTKDFTWSFKIANPELVTVDLSAVDTVAKFTALYQAANSGTTSQFARLMVPSTGLSYDASTGVFSATFKLVDGLTAGTLDDAYQAMKEPLLFPTPAGMINVSAAKLREMSDNGTALVENEPTVNGIFSAKHPTNFALNGFIGGYFPMTFGQNAKAGVRETSITAKVTATSSHSFKSEDGSALPAEVTALVPSAIHGQNVADAVTAPTSTFSDVKVAGGKWTFVGWGTSAKWNDDIATAPDCKIASHVGTWKYVADPAPTPTVAPTTPAPTPTVAPTTPAPTPTVAPTTPAPTPTVAPTTPAPTPTAAPTTLAPKPSEVAPTTSPEKPAPAPSKKPTKAKKKLAHTGATVAGLGFVALAFGGAGVLIVRRRYQ